jgi:hypothetical protein
MSADDFITEDRAVTDMVVGAARECEDCVV